MADRDRDLAMPLWAFTTIVDGQRVTFRFQRRQAPTWVYPRNGGRPYRSGSWRSYDSKPRMYVSTHGESLLDNLLNRQQRPNVVWGRIIRKAMKQVGLPGKIGWYQYAGCSCPCSPGFIWTEAPQVDASWYSDKANKFGDHVYDNGYRMRRYDVWVELEGAPLVKEGDAVDEHTFDRISQLAVDPTLDLALLANTTL